MRNSIKKNNIKNTKLYKKGVSVLLALSLSLNAVSFDVFHGLFGESLTTKVSAAYTVHNDDKDRFDEIGTAFANNDTGKENFLDFCYFYQTDDDFAAKYVNATVSVNFITFPSEFTGFGNRTVKFRGDFRIQDTGNADVYLPCALFTHVYDSAKITNAEGQPMTLKVVKTSDQSSPLLAECVYHDTAEAANSSTWNITASSNNENPYAGIIGEMKEDAKLTLEYANSSAADIISNSDGTNITADVGSICGKMESGAELTASILGLSNVEISSSHGNAGGFVGSMEGNSKLTITSLPSGFAPVVTASGTGEGKGYAGGMIGNMVSSASFDTTALNEDFLTIGGTVNGANGAGGYCGYYVNSAENAVLDLSKYDIKATVSGKSSGGVFGVLENQSAVYTITGGGNGENSPKIASECSGGNYGGVIGTYKTTSLTNTLHLKNMNTFAKATGTLTTFGGVIGKVDSTAYIRTDTVKVKAEGTNKGWFGGLVGETSTEHGVFVDLADFTLDATGFTGGGVIGKFHNGILRLSGITDMTSAKVGGTWTTTAKYGQLVGENNNVLVYAVGDGTAEFDSETGEISTAASGWTFKRSTNSIADDIGTWGEVVRIADAETNILTLDTSAHTVTLKAAQTTMDSAEDLVLTALNIQLNQGSGYDCLLFADTTTSNRDTLLASSLTISDSPSFSGTGVNGFMRDGSDSIGAFTGTLAGGTVTLATGETYGVYSNGQIEGLGQIYRHPYNGLFSVVGSNAEVNNEKPTATVNTLTVDGDINIRNAGMSEMYAGGIAAKVNGNVTLNDITASQKVYYHEGANISSSETKGKSIGGLIGCVSNDANGSTIAVTGTNIINTAFTLSGCHQSWNILGSFIGKVTSPAFTINIAQNTGDTLTDKHKTDISGITTKGANADGGGLIGYITRNGTYSNRKINIDNLIFDDCTVGNVATTNGGGLLGYAWLETDTTIGGTNGITVTNATITNSTPANVGAMCYQATGKWTVNKLAINKLTMTGGAGTSLGMLVNKAYNEYTDSSETKTDGLYLDVLNSGYVLNNVTTTQTEIDPETNEQIVTTLNTIDLPVSGVYDELAVYTAQSVLKGRYTSDNTTYGAGVISINMGTRSDGVVSVAATGTYQNKMTTQTKPKPNPNARYYYNLDKMNNANATQDVVLWSVNKYAAENIKDEFVANENPLNKNSATDINFTGISFYPVYTASDDTVQKVNITFDYGSIYDAESYTPADTNVTTNTDSYIRDPAAANQHYLMQSGLFIEQGEGSTITVNNSSLAGTFLEVGDYKGSLISTTSHGSVKINGLELRGITPKTTGNAAYTDGYLLVNNIERENAQKAMITLQVENVRTATDTNYKYATSVVNSSTRTTQVTKSLFGEVYGPGLNISFNKMKLDAREPGTLADNTALNTAYGTLNSIFTDSTFLASLKTDALPMPYYNYTFEEDWGENGTGGTRWVTYGKEVSSSVEHEDREHRYYKSEDKFTDPTSATASEPSTVFNSEWLPYVKQEYTANQTHDANGCYFRELRVNISDVVKSFGCGTYNDPYIINSDNQNGSDKKFLENVAAFLKSGDGHNLPNVILPTNKDDYDTLAENTSGARWCETKNHHADFEYDETNNKYTYTPTEGEPISWKTDDVRLYLENAYYKVEGSIALSGGENGFVGLGADSATNPTGNYAFRGVIVGANNATITNNSSNPLILISNGCVVKNITVVQNVNAVLTQNITGSGDASFGYKLPSHKTGTTGTDSGCSYYGGIIGEIMGGDNIIDNCYVTQETGVNVSLNGDYGSICPVGSYVGVVVFGGLIFKNMSPTDANRNAQNFKVYMGSDTSVNLTAASSKGAIYVNPYVGRVINGYAVNETEGANGRFSVTENSKYHDDDNTPRSGNVHSLKNGTKHYSIADINRSETNKLDVTAVATSSADGNINVPNAQALFVLSLITQSTAGTAPSLFGTGNGTHTDKITEDSRITDENGNVTIYQTRTITDVDDSLCDYSGSLSYGTYNDCVYGMSHTANYDEVGTNESSSSDYSTYVTYDTAAKSALPYIINHYTVGGLNVSSTSVEGEPVVVTNSTSGTVASNPFTGNDPDGDWMYIMSGSKYLNASSIKEVGLQAETDRSNATKMLFTKQNGGENDGKYTISFDNGNTRTYIGFKTSGGTNDLRQLINTTTEYYFTVEKQPSGKWRVHGDIEKEARRYIGLRNSTHFTGQNSSSTGIDLEFYLYTPGSTITTTTITTTITNTNSIMYPARCITSTSGYYNINLTGTETYQLPDSFRGLGCVGIYDAAADTAVLTNTAKFGIKLNTFDGKGCTIDEDIYLNKYESDNYFNVLHAGGTQLLSGDSEEYKGNGSGGINTNHGIGLFDSVITKNVSSSIKDFYLSGSVNTEVYANSDSASGQELALITTNRPEKSMWLSVGGVCGWSGNGIHQTFDKIRLNTLAVNGADFVGGLLGFSGTSSTTVLVTARECSATNISIKMSSANAVNWKTSEDNSERARNGIGCFIGKVLEGGVRIFGAANTSETTLNKDLTKFSTVTIKEFGFADDSLEYYTAAGGLVGFAGNGCKVYDMKVMPAEGQTITIGSDKTRYAGGLVGLMQPKDKGGQSCAAVFYNCTVQEINVNGHYAGGFYGGKWINDWSSYSIKIDTCQMIGNTSSNNTITGNNMANNGYVGGFLGCGNVYTDGNPNIEITDSRVINYTITSNATTAYVGGFIGYTGAQAANKSITCYIHDSTVEDCEIGKTRNYAGGAIGYVKRQGTQSNNKILGYNIKLDTVTNNGSYKGAWIGFVDNNDNTTSIQFNGVGIYENGFTQNVGNRSNFSNASFVFADYDGVSNSMTTSNKNKATFNIGADVAMPKYPYVNVNPQSNMGIRSDSTHAVISGDGAVLLKSKVSTYGIYTSGQTMAAKLYADIKAGTSDRRYTTCGDMLKNNEIADGHKFEYYLQRNVTDDGDRISTYKTEKGSLPQGIDDFACIMISTADEEETTNLINQYIRLVTNTTNDYADTNDYYDVDIKTCKLIKNETTGTGEFKLITDTNDSEYSPGIVHDVNNKKFKMTEIKGNADSSKEDTFTLIDVQFKDPLDTNKVAYHLYVPVYTSVQLKVSFSASVKTGSNSVSYQANGITVKNSDYETLMNKEEYIHIDNLNSWYTMYFRYSYAKADLMPLLERGNLNWNHDKYVMLTKIENDITNMLPTNTFMTLVDPNSGSDKIYYASGLNSTDFPRESFVENGKTKVKVKLDFNKFTGVDNQTFKVASLNEMIAQNLEAVQIEANAPKNGLYDLYEGEGVPADFNTVSYVYVMDGAGNKTYYKYNANHEGTYELQFKAGFENLNEDYYVSVYVPETDMSKIYGYDISIDKKFAAPRAVGTNALPKSANVVTQYSSRLVYLGDLYDQTVTFEMRTSDQVITGSNKKLDAYAKTEISAKSVPVLGILASAKDYTSLFHSYVLTLDRHGENGEIMTQIYGLDPKEDRTPRVEAWYSFDEPISDVDTLNENRVNDVDVQSNYINVKTVNAADKLMEKIAPNVNDKKTVTIYSRVRMDFDETKLETEFPQKTRNDAGVSARVSSNLAYDTNGLAFSSSSVAASDALNHLYYRTSMDTANLYYKALTPNLDKYDYDGEYSENYTRVGVNGRRSMSDYMPIDTVANYDLSKVSQSWSEASKIRLNISLQKKTDTVENGKVTKVRYEDVTDITQYWGGLVLTDDGKPVEIMADSSGSTRYQLTPTETASIWVESGNSKQLVSIPANTSAITVDIPKNLADYDASTDTIEIHIAFNAKTGTQITNYANYKVNLTANLLDSNEGVIEACNATDYMIYTNAKLNNEFLNSES